MKDQGMFDIEVKIAENKKEIQQALRLRREVFKRELGTAAQREVVRSPGRDKYDNNCDHLIVIDKKAGKVVGTYRLMLGSRLDEKIGFYSERFFDIRNIKRLTKEAEVLELGRSCVDRDYRSGPVVNLLWSGIAKYVTDHNVRYLFGCPRIHALELTAVSKIFKFMKERFYAPDEFRVYPKLENRVKGLKKNIPLPSLREIWHQLPPLVKGYLRLGVLVCGEPAFNPESAVVYICTLLDIQKIPSAYRQHYF